jgi:hypothetical protein
MSLAAPAPSRPARPRREPAKPAGEPRRSNARATLARPRAALLGGIVAVNVAALRNSIEAGRVSGQVASLRAENQSLQSHVAELSGVGRISALAKRMNMVLAQPNKQDYLRLHPGRHRPVTATGPTRVPQGPAQREPSTQRTP